MASPTPEHWLKVLEALTYVVGTNGGDPYEVLRLNWDTLADETATDTFLADAKTAYKKAQCCVLQAQIDALNAS